MIGLLIIAALGLFVLCAILYATRLDDNYEVMGDVEEHPGYRFGTNRRGGLGLPLANRSPADVVYTTELDASRALRRASRREDEDGDGDGEAEA